MFSPKRKIVTKCNDIQTCEKIMDILRNNNKSHDYIVNITKSEPFFTPLGKFTMSEISSSIIRADWNTILKENHPMEIVHIYTHLLNAVLLLNEIGVVSFGINEDTILYDASRLIPLISDFSSSFVIKESNSFVKVQSNVFVPIEARVLSFMAGQSDAVLFSYSAAKDICSTTTQNISFFVSEEFGRLYEDDCMTICVERYVGKTSSEIRRLIATENIFSTWDLFSVHIFVAELLKFQPLWGPVFGNTILMGIHPDPDRRLSARDAIRSIQYAMENWDVFSSSS